MLNPSKLSIKGLENLIQWLYKEDQPMARMQPDLQSREALEEEKEQFKTLNSQRSIVSGRNSVDVLMVKKDNSNKEVGFEKELELLKKEKENDLKDKSLAEVHENQFDIINQSEGNFD